MLDIPNSLLVMTALFNAGLTLFILRGNVHKIGNVLFGLFLLSLSLWSLALIGFLTTNSDHAALVSIKFSYIFALVIGVSYYLFSIVFPEGVWPRILATLVIVGITVMYAVALLASDGFLIKEIVHTPSGKELVFGKLEFILFSIILCALFVGGLTRTWFKYARAATGTQKTQLFVVALSVSTAGIAGTYFNLVLPSPLFNDFRYIWTGPLFTSLIAISIMYSVFRFHLFNAKVILTELLISLLWIVTFLRTVLASEQQEQLFNAILFFLAFIIGSLLIKSVRREVEQRELIQKQEQELEVVNKQQEGLLHFISHEVKGYLTKNEAGFSAIASGDYGEVQVPLKRMSEEALADTRKGVETVMNILDASNLKKGTVAYDKKSFDLAKAVEETVAELAPAAREKKIRLDFRKTSADQFTIVGDEEKLRRHVIRNIIDNSIKYTPHGEVTVGLARTDSLIRLTIADTGVGITKEDMAHLFTEGGRGAEAIKVNVHSTGYGLFIAKAIVEAHGGKIWAESEGRDKGSRFIVELPLAK